MTTTVLRSGKINDNGSVQAQHVDLYRKLLLRRKLLSYAVPGAIYVPFIGEGDIAAECFAGSKVYGADLDVARVATASKQLKGCRVIVADCNGWPFPGVAARFSIADFDAYSDPYASFRSFWESARKAHRLVLFFTDGHRQAIKRSGHWYKPDGSHSILESLDERRVVYNMYFPKYIKPWFVETIGSNWHIIKELMYLRRDMLYWGTVIEHG